LQLDFLTGKLGTLIPSPASGKSLRIQLDALASAVIGVPGKA
jgi:hypothetical protein